MSINQERKDKSFNFKMFSPLRTPDYIKAKTKLKKKHESDVDSDVSMVTRDIRKEVESVKKKVIEEREAMSDEDLFKTQTFPSFQEHPVPNKQSHSDSSSDSESSSSSLDIDDLKKKIMKKKLEQNSAKIDVMSPNAKKRVSSGPKTNESVSGTFGKKKLSNSDEESSVISARKKMKLSGNEEKQGTISGRDSSSKTATGATISQQTLTHTDSGDKSARMLSKTSDFDLKTSSTATQMVKENSKTKVVNLPKHIEEKSIQSDYVSSSDSERLVIDFKTDETSKNSKRKSSSSSSGSETKHAVDKLGANNRYIEASSVRESEMSLKRRSKSDLGAYSSHNMSSSSNSSSDEQEKGKKPVETNIDEKKDGNHSGNRRDDRLELVGKEKSFSSEKSTSSSDDEEKSKEKVDIGKGEAEVDIRKGVKEKERKNSGSESDSSAMSNVLPYHDSTVLKISADNIDMEVEDGPYSNNRTDTIDREKETVDGTCRNHPPKDFEVCDFRKMKFYEEFQFSGKKLFLIKATSGIDIDSLAYSRCKERINVPGKTSVGIEDKQKRIILNVDHNPPKEVRQIRLMSRIKSGSSAFLIFGKAIEGQIHVTSETSSSQNVTFHKQKHQKHEVTESRQKMLIPYGSESPIRETVIEEQDIDYNSKESEKQSESQRTGDFEAMKIHKNKKKKTSLDVLDAAESTIISEKEHKKKKKKRKREIDETKDTVVSHDEEDNKQKTEVIQDIHSDPSETVLTSTHKHKKKKKKSKINSELQVDQNSNINSHEELVKINGEVTELERTESCDIPDDSQAAEKKKKRKKKKKKESL